MSKFLNEAAATATVWSYELRERAKGAASRAAEQRGQTAAEYMGVLLLVGVVIFALIQSPIPDTIAKAVDRIITDISTGKKPTDG